MTKFLREPFTQLCSATSCEKQRGNSRTMPYYYCLRGRVASQFIRIPVFEGVTDHARILSGVDLKEPQKPSYLHAQILSK